ncbi:MAG: enoyl-CoA hydratase/isomerase family protein [Gammaproteobacteria bacterium]|nr:enoyl-CoA hydratase/isomerase family protein [Gammaproteobacteria bacterium]MBI5618595.1 enoyl-CoA hydratase/isomerase family protein [Gammaproteobacteria bacterium]
MDFSSYECFKFERRGRILTATIARGGDGMNAVNGQLHGELARVFRDLDADPDSDILVLAGEGRAFCAGGDAAWLAGMMDDPAKFEHTAQDGKRIVFSMLECEKPILCRLHGAAVGLGATLALLCDVVIAAEHVMIGDPHVKMGVVAGDGGALIWPQLIACNRAKELLMTGELIKAPEAEAAGLVNHVVPLAELDAKVYGLAEQLAHGALMAIRWTKIVANIPLRERAQQMMDASLAYETATGRTADHREAVQAFRDKRAPVFQGK